MHQNAIGWRAFDESLEQQLGTAYSLAKDTTPLGYVNNILTAFNTGNEPGERVIAGVAAGMQVVGALSLLGELTPTSAAREFLVDEGAWLSRGDGSTTRGETTNLIRRVDVEGLESVSRIQLEKFGEAVAKNRRASQLYNHISRSSINVDLNFGPVPRTLSGDIVPGQFSRVPGPGNIKVFARGHSSVEEAVGTFGHEARHALDWLRGLPLNTQFSEYRAFVEDFIVRTGRVPARNEMGILAREVNQLYPNLPRTPQVERIMRY